MDKYTSALFICMMSVILIGWCEGLLCVVCLYTPPLKIGKVPLTPGGDKSCETASVGQSELSKECPIDQKENGTVYKCVSYRTQLKGRTSVFKSVKYRKQLKGRPVLVKVSTYSVLRKCELVDKDQPGGCKRTESLPPELVKVVNTLRAIPNLSINKLSAKRCVSNAGSSTETKTPVLVVTFLFSTLAKFWFM